MSDPFNKHVLVLLALVFIASSCGGDDRVDAPIPRQQEKALETEEDSSETKRTVKQNQTSDGEEPDIKTEEPPGPKVETKQVTTPADEPRGQIDPVPIPIKSPAPTLPQKNKELSDWAKGQLGKKIGDGLCQALQDAALAAVGAKILTSFANVGPNGFGLSLIDSDTALLPGDIMRWQGGTNHNNYLSDPTAAPAPKIKGYLTFKAVPEGHVSIISEVLNANEVKVLHQNINNMQVVREDSLRLDAIVTGKIEFFRPVKIGVTE